MLKENVHSINANNELFKGVYEEGDEAESFYILKEGTLRVETMLTYEKRNIWPVVELYQGGNLC